MAAFLRLLLVVFLNLVSFDFCSGSFAYTSCVGIPDGLYNFQLEISGPVVAGRCSNEYLILDFSLDNGYSTYFTSFTKWHSMVAAPEKNDHPNWEQWFIPAKQYISSDFILSPDCHTCDETSEWQLNGKTTAYYMNSFGFTCFDPKRGVTACDADFFTQECNYCGWDDTEQHLLTYKRDQLTQTWEDLVDEGFGIGVCNFEIRNSRETVLTTYLECSNEENAWKPTLGMKGEKCMCFKPNSRDPNAVVDTVDVNYHLPKKDPLPKQKEGLLDNLDVFYLYQKDFRSGTYRITQSGKYKIMEDIVFDFNGMTEAELESMQVSPNDPLLNYWWPTDASKYPGAGGYRNAYFLGYFAGITIECDGVDLDLGGHELSMSKAFFFQQPYFALIELSSQAFIPQQGPGIFGSDIESASNTQIHSGRLGRSSHHAIHGNYNSDIVIYDISAYNFFSHGIQLNGFEGVTIENVDIGPNTREASLNAGYSHLRFLLPNARKIADDHGDKVITFRGEEYTMSDILDTTVALMDEALFYALDPVNREISEEASIFLNKNGKGIPFGTVCYGLFLNYPGAGIFGWHSNNVASNDLTLNNVAVHDMDHMGIEVFGGTYAGRAFANAFAAPLDFKDLFGSREALFEFGAGRPPQAGNPLINFPYVGNLISDFHLAFYKFAGDNFDFFPGIAYVGVNEELLLWAEGDDDYIYWMNNGNDKVKLICNQDAMFHSGKGLLGIKISGVENIEMQKISVYNLHDFTHFGCAPELQSDDDADNFFLSYEPGTETYNNFFALSQQKPYQSGFSMNMVMGITIDYSTVKKFSSISVHHLISETGLTFGVALWFQTSVTLMNDFHVSHLTSGRSVEKDLFEYTDLPNRRAEACAFRVIDDDDYPAIISFDDSFDMDADLRIYCVSGNTGCFGDEESFSSVGEAVNDDCEGLKRKPVVAEDATGNIEDAGGDEKKDDATVFENSHVSYLSISALVFFVAFPVVLVLFVLGAFFCKQKKPRLVRNNAPSLYQTF